MRWMLLRAGLTSGCPAGTSPATACRRLTFGIKGCCIALGLSQSALVQGDPTMSVNYKYRVSVPLPAARPAFAPVQPRAGVAAHGLTGALAGTAAGVAVGAGASALVPGV